MTERSPDQPIAHSPQKRLPCLGSRFDDIEWLIATRQFNSIQICGKRLILGSDIDELLRVYQQVQQRGLDGK
jgi:hypothetical protein